MNKYLVGLILLGASLFASAEIVTVPIPGAPGLSVTVGTGVNALPLADIRNNPSAVNITSGDDDYRNVPLGFDFPMYGQKFNNSWAMTNGMVTFKDPAISGIGGACCSGIDLRNTTGTNWNYSIFGLHTDLYSWNGANQYYLSKPNEMTYGWYNTSTCCSSQGGNSFEIKINSSGLIDTRIAGTMLGMNTVTSGFSGDLSKGEYFQQFHGQGWNPVGGISWQALGGTGAGAPDLCIADPLSSPACPNYFVAQCTVSALFNPSCPGYAALYFTQQCSANQLYDTSCPGYANAYLNYQCNIDALYSTTCAGYEQAYFNQQCGLSPLYSQSCRGYAVAYHDQQCSINPLFATDCVGYSTAYFNQQCNLNGLYDRTCPNYSTAYATKMLLERQGTASIVATAGVIARMPVDQVEAINSPAAVSTTGDSNIDRAIAPPPPTANSAAAPSAPVQLVQAPPPPPPPPAPAKNDGGGEKKPEGGPDKQGGGDKPAGGPTQMAQNEQGGSKPAAPSARQEIQARREAAAKAAAVESGKNLANQMGKAADMEAQKAVQNVVIQAMGFTPGFDAYGKTMIPDTVGYKPFTVYNNQKNIDSRANLRMWTGTDRLHNDMVDSQYKEK